MKKQPERTARTRRALVDSFWNLYCEKSIEKITVKEIVAGAGVYRSTFYEYFADVYNVLDEIKKGLVESYLETSLRFKKEERFEVVLEDLLQFYDKNGEYVAVLLGPNGDREFYKTAKELIIATFYSRIDTTENELQRDLVFEIMSSSVISVLNYWHEHKETLELREVLMESSEFLKKGMLPYFKKLGIVIQ